MITNKHELPEPVYQAVVKLHEKYHGDKLGDITTTRLISPPQIMRLREIYKEEIVEDAMDLLYSLEGNLFHMMFEVADTPGWEKEKRVGANILGWKLTGKYDAIEKDTLYDYKFTTVWSYIYGKKEWTLQANVNRWLLHKNGVEINHLVNWLLFRDWSKSKVKGDYPEVKMMPVNLPVWSLDEAEDYIKHRVKLHQRSTVVGSQYLGKCGLECSDEDRWWNDRKKKFNRCEDYCNVKQFCKQYRPTNE